MSNEIGDRTTCAIGHVRAISISIPMRHRNPAELLELHVTIAMSVNCLGLLDGRLPKLAVSASDSRKVVLRERKNVSTLQRCPPMAQPGSLSRDIPRLAE